MPIIYTLQNASNADKQKIINIVKNENKNKAKVDWVIAFVKQNGGIQYAEQKMRAYQAEAFELLNQFPDSESKNSLIELVKYTIERRK